LETAQTHNLTKLRLGLIAAAFLFVMVMFAPISHAGGLGFAPLAAIAGIAGYLGITKGVSTKGVSMSRIPPVIWALGLFLFWVIITSSWSPYNDQKTLTNPAKLGIGVAVYLGAFLLTPRAWVGKALAGISVLLLLLMLYDLHTDYHFSKLFYELGETEHPIARQNSIYQNLGHSITVLALMMGPVLLYLSRYGTKGRIAGAIWTGVFLYCAFKAGLSVGVIAGCATGIFLVLGYYFKARALDILTAGAIASILFAPLAGYCMRFISAETKANISDSWEHRVEMWGYVAEKIAEKPIFGHGFDATRTFDRTYSGMKSITGGEWEQTIVSLHPHNAGLHIWSETGAIGAALACLTLFLLRQRLNCVMAGKPDMILPMVGFLAAALTLCTFTYGIWQEWLWGVYFLIGALIPMSILNAR